MFIENAQWRYATKKYDADRKVSDSNIDILKQAIQLSASSFGLQPYKVLIVTNPEIRTQLQPASWNQPQIIEASHLFVFAHMVDVNEADIDAHFDHVIQTRNLKRSDIQGYIDYMKPAVMAMSNEQRNIWAAKQTYIALGNLLNAAADLKIDATPMEGFDPAQYDAILGLTNQRLHATLVGAVGYRHADDINQHVAKVRKPSSELFINL